MQKVNWGLKKKKSKMLKKRKPKNQLHNKIREKKSSNKKEILIFPDF